MDSTRLATEKQQILEREGYRYNFDREIYLNRKTKKAFSIAFIEDRSTQEIEQRIHEDAQGTGEWRFFFTQDPSDSVKRQLINLLG